MQKELLPAMRHDDPQPVRGIKTKLLARDAHKLRDQLSFELVRLLRSGLGMFDHHQRVFGVERGTNPRRQRIGVQRREPCTVV